MKWVGLRERLTDTRCGRAPCTDLKRYQRRGARAQRRRDECEVTIRVHRQRRRREPALAPLLWIGLEGGLRQVWQTQRCRQTNRAYRHGPQPSADGSIWGSTPHSKSNALTKQDDDLLSRSDVGFYVAELLRCREECPEMSWPVAETLSAAQRSLEVLDQIVARFQPDRQPHKPVADSSARALRRRHSRVRSG